MDAHKFRFKIGWHGEAEYLEIDGKPLDGVVSMELSAGIRRPTTLTLRLLVEEVEIEGEGDVRILREVEVPR